MAKNWPNLSSLAVAVILSMMGDRALAGTCEFRSSEPAKTQDCPRLLSGLESGQTQVAVESKGNFTQLVIYSANSRVFSTSWLQSVGILQAAAHALEFDLSTAYFSAADPMNSKVDLIDTAPESWQADKYRFVPTSPHK